MASTAQPEAPRLGVVIPLANEADNVTAFLAAVSGQLTAADRVFCVLDGASRDATRDLVAAAATRDDRVVLVWAPENRCVVDAYFRGYRAALDAGCRWILEMDGGFSHNPAEIPRLVAAMESGAEFAAGSRFARGGVYRGPAWRYVVSRGGTVLANLLLGTRMHDMTSGFECFSRPAMEYVVGRGVRSHAHFFQTEIRYMLRDWRWVEVPISYRNPSKRLGKDSLGESFRILWQLRREARTGKG